MTNYEWLKQQIKNQKREPTRECIEWPFATNSYGYGVLRFNHKNHLAHRLAYKLHYNIPPERQLYHLCLNRVCVNPLHLLGQGMAFDYLREKIADLKQSPADRCVFWPYGRDNHGYGYVWVPDQAEKQAAHRVAYALYHNIEIPSSDEFVLHHCDRPGCINPKHLYLGWHTENQRDKVRRNRHPVQKLTIEDVEQILDLLRDKSISYPEIANKFGVSRGCISSIASGRNWTHVKPNYPRERRKNRKKQGATKLNEAQVKKIIDLLQGGATVAEIAERFKVSPGCITSIRIGKTWRYLPRPRREE